MLVLKRNVSETIHVGDVTITLVSAGRGRATIGIDAPRDVPIRRGEHMMVQVVAVPTHDGEPARVAFAGE